MTSLRSEIRPDFPVVRCDPHWELFSPLQTEFLRRLTEEISDNSEHFLEGDFMLNEFVDRFGPRLAHLNGVLQVLSQLSAITNAPNQQPEIGE